MRLRIGLESKVNDKVTVGVGLATGSRLALMIILTMPPLVVYLRIMRVQPNQTFTGAFSKKPILWI